MDLTTIDDSLAALGVAPAIAARERCGARLQALEGYLGAIDGDRVRLCADLSADDYVELAKADLAHVERAPNVTGEGSSRVRLFLRDDAQVREVSRRDMPARRSQLALHGGLGNPFDRPVLGPIDAIDPVRPIPRVDCVADCEGVFAAAATQMLLLRQRGLQALQRGHDTQADQLFRSADELEQRSVGALTDCLYRCRTRPRWPSVPDLVNRMFAKYVRPISQE